MSDHVTNPMSDHMTADTTIVRALDLAERLLDEVARAGQDWQTVARLAQELAALARRADSAGTGRDVSPHPP